MNRYLFVFTLSLFAGILLITNWPVAASWLLLLAVSGTLGMGFAFYFTKHNPGLLLIVVGIMAGGIVGHCADRVDTKPLYPYVGQKVRLELVVTERPVVKESTLRVTGTVTRVNDAPCKGKITVSIYGKPEVRMNDMLVMEQTKLQLPAPQSNFGGFDYARYLKSQNIYVTGAANQKNLSIVGAGGAPILREARACNQWLGERIDRIFTEKTAPFLKAVLLGDKSGLAEETKGFFSASGLSHIMAVSGLHVSVILLLFGGLLKWTGMRRGIQDILCAGLLVGFVLITGGSPSVIRAAVMLMVIRLSYYVRREQDSITALGLAGLVITVVQPLAVYDAGFALSFFATFGILTLAKPIGDKFSRWMPDKIGQAFGVTLAAQAGTLPLMIYYFGQVPLLALLANIVVFFFLPFLFLFAILALCIPWSPLVWLGEGIPRLIEWVAEAMSVYLPGQLLQIPRNSFLLLGAVVSAGALIGLFGKWKKQCRVLACAGAAIFLLGYWTSVAPPARLSVTFLNVGQGDCALIRTTGGKNYLVDTGTQAMAEAEVIPYLKRNGIRKIDGVFLSHLHEDHAGGVPELFRQVKVEKMLVSPLSLEKEAHKTFLNLCTAYQVEVEQVESSAVFTDRTVRFQVLKTGPGTTNENDSMVLRFQYGHSSFLFTGDTQTQEEEKLRHVTADVLKVAHHGSSTSSAEQFIKRAAPQIAVISVGKDNSYKLPSQAVIDRLIEQGAEVYRTDRNGTVQVLADEMGNYQIKTVR